MWTFKSIYSTANLQFKSRYFVSAIFPANIDIHIKLSNRIKSFSLLVHYDLANDKFFSLEKFCTEIGLVLGYFS